MQHERPHRQARVSTSCTVTAATMLLVMATSLGAQRRPATSAIPYVPPTGTWERRSPSTLGMDSTKLAEAIATPGYRGRAERAFVLRLDAFDWNCPQHITPRFDAPDVAQAIGKLQQRIEELEAENVRLRDSATKPPA